MYHCISRCGLLSIIVNIQFIPVMVLLLILEYYFTVYAWPHQISLIHISKYCLTGYHISPVGPYVLLLTLTSTALFVMIGMAFMRYTPSLHILMALVCGIWYHSNSINISQSFNILKFIRTEGSLFIENFK